MCGRYYRRSDKQRIAEAFNVGELPIDFVLPEWDYNVAPSTFQPIIRESKHTGDREIVLMRWGLVPFFTKQLSDVKGISTSSREQSRSKESFLSHSIQEATLLVPADGFYEWKKLYPKRSSHMRSA